jgi:hypothetical protein
MSKYKDVKVEEQINPLCGLVVRVTRKKKVMSLKRGPLSLLCTTEELLDRKVAAPV